MIKLAVNQMQDVQGFHAHITAAHMAHIVSSEGEGDPDYALKVPKADGDRWWSGAFENYRLRKGGER